MAQDFDFLAVIYWPAAPNGPISHRHNQKEAAIYIALKEWFTQTKVSLPDYAGKLSIWLYHVPPGKPVYVLEDGVYTLEYATEEQSAVKPDTIRQITIAARN